MVRFLSLLLLEALIILYVNPTNFSLKADGNLMSNISRGLNYSINSNNISDINNRADLLNTSSFIELRLSNGCSSHDNNQFHCGIIDSRITEIDCTGDIAHDEFVSCIANNRNILNCTFESDQPRCNITSNSTSLLCVKSQVINEKFGKANPPDFNIHIVSENGASPNSFPGRFLGNCASINPGFYYVYDDLVPGYSLIDSTFDCSGVIRANEEKTCSRLYVDHLITIPMKVQVKYSGLKWLLDFETQNNDPVTLHTSVTYYPSMSHNDGKFWVVNKNFPANSIDQNGNLIVHNFHYYTGNILDKIVSCIYVDSKNSGILIPENCKNGLTYTISDINVLEHPIQT